MRILQPSYPSWWPGNWGVDRRYYVPEKHFNLAGLHPVWGTQLCKHLDSDHTAGLNCPFLVLRRHRQEQSSATCRLTNTRRQAVQEIASLLESSTFVRPQCVLLWVEVCSGLRSLLLRSVPRWHVLGLPPARKFQFAQYISELLIHCFQVQFHSYILTVAICTPALSSLAKSGRAVLPSVELF